MADSGKHSEELPEKLVTDFGSYMKTAAKKSAKEIKEGGEAAYTQAAGGLKGEIDKAYDGATKGAVAEIRDSLGKVADAYKDKLDFSKEMDEMKKNLKEKTEEAIKKIKIRSPFDTEV